MIEATIYNRALAEVSKAWLRAVPHVGDILWIGKQGQPAGAADEAMRVVEVAHQINTAWRPELVDASQPPHRLILNVEIA